MSTMTHSAYRALPSPIGRIRIGACCTPTGPAISEVRFCRTAVAMRPVRPALARLLDEAEAQFQAYLEGSTEGFRLPLVREGTCLQMRVWNEVLRIPRGRTIACADLAERIGATQDAVAKACAANPIAIVIPTHRVLPPPSFGRRIVLAETTQFLLELEGAELPTATGARVASGVGAERAAA